MTESAVPANLHRFDHPGEAIGTEARATSVTFSQRRLLRGLYIGRLVLAGALFLAVTGAGLAIVGSARMIVSLALVGAIGFTAASFIWTDLRKPDPGMTFLYLQVTFDMLLVTAAVHVTWSGGQSQLAPLYILVIAVSALLVAPSGVPLVASLGMVLYFADAMLAHGGNADSGLLIQLMVFAIVAVTSGTIAARLRAAGSASEQLAAELAKFRLREADVRSLTLRAERLEGVAEMSASLAHEIKNPLASIRSAVEQLSRMPRASEDEKTLSTLVLRESDRLARVLTEFLDFARAGMTRVESLNIAEIARNAARLASSQPDIAPGVKVVYSFPAAPMIIEGDEDLIHRAMFNLILNAVQASPPNGEVRIEGGELQPHQLPPGNQEFAAGAYGIVVINKGPGIASQVRDRLFDPFVTTKPGGSGLGLSIVQRAVQAHGGLVTVSPPGEETRFTVVLPKSG
ncbi:MAG: ATP-binding protein [Gemmatimonadaceae bacterium]|nr:ATP-binding protein [Gemmatimonadaceae bacterium]